MSNLTSTVKKLNGNKNFNFKDKLDHLLSGQSMIHEANSDNEQQPESSGKDKTLKISSVNQEKEPMANDDFRLKIVYFMRDFSKVTASLKDLANVDLKNVHENSAADLKLLNQALSSTSKKWSE